MPKRLIKKLITKASRNNRQKEKETNKLEDNHNTQNKIKPFVMIVGYDSWNRTVVWLQPLLNRLKKFVW